MDKEFFPNACFICKATANLKRCSRCQMISYCGEKHQKEHWPDHKDLCTTISTMKRERGVSHLFEKLKDTDLHTWRREKMAILEEAESRCKRFFDMNDSFLFQFSRSCFVCHESRQNLLKNCPGCPAASFCKDHPSSPIHDIDCANLKKTLEIGIQLSDRIEKHGLIQTQMVLTSVLHAIKFSNSSELVSMEDFLLKYSNSKNLSLKIAEDLQFWLSQMYSTILTVFNALQKLEFTARSKLTIHMQNQDDCEGTDLWEALLHLLPELKDLKISFIDPGFRLGFKLREIDLCRECKKKEKKLILDYLAPSYDACLRGNFAKPDLLIHTDIADSETTDYSERKMAPSLLKLWSRLHCPLVTTSIIEEYHEEIKNTIQSILGNTDFFFEGYNPFRGFLCIRNNYNRAGMTNQFMIILKPKQ